MTPSMRLVSPILLTVLCAQAVEHGAINVPSSLSSRLRASNHPLAFETGGKGGGRGGGGGIVISPLSYGADPLGKADSAPAFAACVQACVNYSVAIDDLGHYPGDASFGNRKYIANAGGCEINLGGGEFMLSSPIFVPEYIGNLRIGHGSLVADDRGFPANSFLLVVGVEGSCKVVISRHRYFRESLRRS